MQGQFNLLYVISVRNLILEDAVLKELYVISAKDKATWLEISKEGYLGVGNEFRSSLYL